MFRTTATLARPHPSRSWMTMRAPVVFTVVLAAMMPLSALVKRVDERLGVVIPVVMMVGAGVYSVALSRGLQPVLQRVDLAIDARGILVDGALLVARGEMVDAYLRPATDAIRTRQFFYPAQPMRVEVVTARESFLIEGDHDEHTRHILAALGVPARVVPADHVAPTAENARWQGEARSTRLQMTVVMLVMIAVPIGSMLAWVIWSYLHRLPPRVITGG